MPHMIPQIDYLSMWQVETTCGAESVPSDLCNGTADALAPYLKGKQLDEELAELVEGWYCRLSAPGYMDCTEWSGPYASEQEARDAIADMFDVDPDTGEDLDA